MIKTACKLLRRGSAFAAEISGAIKKGGPGRGLRKRSSQLATALGYQVTVHEPIPAGRRLQDPTIR